MNKETKPINIEKLKMKAEYVLLENIRDSLRSIDAELCKIRRLMDKTNRFGKEIPVDTSEPEPKEREVAESDDGSHLHVNTSESKPEPQKTTSQALEVLNFDPSKLEWETVESKSGKGPYERHPFVGQKVQSTPDYTNLRNAILAVQKTGKHILGHKESGYYYWLSEDTNVIMRRKSQW